MESENQVSNLEIGICGVGFVGGALKRWLEAYTDHNLHLYDPVKYPETLTLLDRKLDCVFICVPVPTKSDGILDLSSIYDALSQVSSGIPVFLRSTILPSSLRNISGHRVYPVPEFLNERSAFKDMERNDIIAGIDNDSDLLRLLETAFPGKRILHMKPEEACLAKYAHNVSGAIKVNFFNTVFEMCKLLGVRYERVRQGFLMTGHVDPQCTLVPGPDGRLGYHGSCFPKDTQAFAEFTQSEMIQACVKENTKRDRK